MIRARLRRVADDEGGAVLIMFAVLVVVLLIAAALVIDIAAVRTLRADHQSTSDAAAAAGALTAAETGVPQDVCAVTKAYVEINGTTIGSLSGIDCATWSSAACDPDQVATATDTQNGITVRITYPVTDSSPLMSSSAIGAASQPASAADGDDPCGRVGVEISSTWNTVFGRVAGVEALDAGVHAVARSTLPGGESVPINLLVLDRTGCQSLLAAGNGGILVAPVVNPDLDGDPSNGLTPGLVPGVAAADSDASSGCVGVIDLDGSNSIIQSDGPAGCAEQLGSDYPYAGFAAGAGCGRIQSFAPGTPGCNVPACSIGGGGQLPLPEPTALPARLTRAPIDHRFNCRSDYATLNPSLAWATDPLTAANEQDIGPCADAATTAPHVHDLIGFVGPSGAPPGFQTWSSAGHKCNLSTSDPPLVLSGNWHVDCANLKINSTLIFDGGNVVFDGDVEIEASGTLAVNTVASIPTDPSTYSASSAEAWVVLRDGELKKAGQGSLHLLNTTVYASKSSTVSLSGGSSGTLRWIAPDQGDFDDLALWSDSPQRVKLAGQALLTLEGTFFAPLAVIEYTGNGSQQQVRAQFIAKALSAGGNGALVVSPEFGRAVEFPVSPTTDLIR